VQTCGVSWFSRKSVAILPFVCACAVSCGGPRSPSGGPTLVVTAIDKSTGQMITSDIFGIAVSVQGPATRTIALAGGAATFRALPPGTYVVTARADYGYEQATLNLTVGGDQAVALNLMPIDDAIVTEVFVEGRGIIGKGATIDVPATGVNFRMRGKYQSMAAPWEMTYVIVEMLAADGRAYGASSCCQATHVVTGPNSATNSRRWNGAVPALTWSTARCTSLSSPPPPPQAATTSAAAASSAAYTGFASISARRLLPRRACEPPP